MFRKTSRFNRDLVGLLGVPSQGKSTLFNAVTQSALAATAPYPFTTLTAQRQNVSVFDERLHQLAKFAKSQKTVPTEITIADIPGLIAGSSKGEGCGNQFLNDVRTASALLHVVRCFDASGFDAANPVEDLSVISSELILSDLQSVERKGAKKSKGGKKSPAATGGAAGGVDFDEATFAKEVQAWLEEGNSARDLPSVRPLPPLEPGQSADEKRRRAQRLIRAKRSALEQMQLLSAKPILYVANVDEDSVKNGNKHSAKLEEILGGGDKIVRVCALVEEQLAPLESRAEKLEMLSAFDLSEPASEEMMRRVFSLLGLHTFFTVGPQMSKSWKYEAGSTVKEAAGLIHGDFERHFRSARTMLWSDFAKHQNLVEAERKMGKNLLGAGDLLEDGHVMIVDHDAKK